MAWCWSTSSWAMMVKTGQEELGTGSLYPATSFWIAFFPVMMTAAVLLAFYSGLALWYGKHVLKIEETGVGHSTWYWGGAASMFGQLCSVMAFSAAAPALVFVVRASQTLLGSLLGVPGLGKSWSWQLVAAVVASFSAVAWVSFASIPKASWVLAEPFIAARTDQIVGRVGLIFTLVCAVF